MNTFDLQHRRDALWQQLRAVACQSPFVSEAFSAALGALDLVDRFWSYPGREVLERLHTYLERGQHALLTQLVNNCCHQMARGRYRRQVFSPFQSTLEALDKPALHDAGQLTSRQQAPDKPYFEVLVVHPVPQDFEALYRQQLASFQTAQDEFVYGLVFVDSAQDALTALLANTDIQACVYLQHVQSASAASSPLFTRHSRALLATTPPAHMLQSVEANLSVSARCLRPEIDHILISEQSALALPLEVRRHFDRVLFHINPFADLHAAILAGVRNRFSTPFFDALQAYSRQPKGVFHALPLSRGASVKDSPWIGDMLDFYGDNIFLAETSSTQGGMDSLLDPTGAIKQAHAKAARTFGADHSYFVTNGTSTSNKIVLQANVRPGDIVLVSADCHKSVPYGVMLAGAYPVFLETYPLPEHDLFGAVDLAQIKAVLLDLQKQGLLHRVKQITLTSSTFDGLIYHAEKTMMEILALKPDVIFHWDEAWFAFGHFHPLYHSRTAMSAVQKIRARLQDPLYWQFYTHWKAAFDANTDPLKWEQVLFPDPQQVCLRVYVTQSTHKTLTAFRQASMIHVADAAFNAARFLEAFRIHTSTSPNYQIIASLDIARRQAALEGFAKVRDTLALSLQLRERIRTTKALRPYFEVLDDEHLVSAHLRQSPTDTSVEGDALSALSAAWGQSELVVDPTRITLNVARTGMDGSSFRQLLMTRYDIQVNKTSQNTVLFLMTIGATQASVDYLLQVLLEMAAKFQYERRSCVRMAGEATPALPGKRRFHAAFLPLGAGRYCAVDIRSAYFDGALETNVAYVPLSHETLAAMQAGGEWVSAAFVTPYPPGFPVLVPGQVLTPEIFHFLHTLKVREIHGFHAEAGFKVFSAGYLARRSTPLPMAQHPAPTPVPAPVLATLEG